MRNLRSKALVPLLVAVALTWIHPASGEEHVIKIAGGINIQNVIAARRSELEAKSGSKLKVLELGPERGLQAMLKNFVEAVTFATSPQEIFDSFKAGGGEASVKLDDFEWVEIGRSPIYAIVSPDNPVKSLSHDQVVDLLRGKTKTWEGLSGIKDPITIYINSNLGGIVTRLPQIYLHQASIPVAHMVSGKSGLINNLKRDRGAITFVSSKFEEPDFQPRFIALDSHLSHYMTAKKPVRADVQRLLDALRVRE